MTVSKKSLQCNGSFKKSPGSDAFVIYITVAPVRGETTKNWLAHCTNTSNVLSTTCGTKAFALDTYNTLEKAQMKKLSNASEKGDKFWDIKNKNFFRGRPFKNENEIGVGLWDAGSLYGEGLWDLRMKLKLQACSF